ncbi:hypothetical protein CHUAL_013592 [Chamberlinius hualienensis]
MYRTKYSLNFFLIVCVFISFITTTAPNILNGLQHKLHVRHQQFVNAGQLPIGSITFNNGQWVATVNCTYDYNKDVDASWHSQEVIGANNTTFRRVDLINNRENEFVDVVTSENEVISTLTITDFTAENIGLYNCMFAQPFGFFNRTYLLDSAPIIDGGSEILVENGETVTITCISFTKSHLYWRLPFLTEMYSPTIASSDDDSSSTTTLTFLADKKHTSDSYQCCSKRNATYLDASDINSGLSEQCTTFSIEVKGPPSASIDVKCIQGSLCILSCYFYSFPAVNFDSIAWSNCDSAGSNCQDIDTTKFTYNTFGSYTIQTGLVITFDSSLPYYICTAGNDYGSSSKNTIITETIYFSPTFSYGQSIAFVKNETDSFTAVMTCSFTSNPPPVIYWIREELNGESLGLVTLSDEYNIKETTFSTLNTISVLNISNYQSSDIARYACVAVNEMGTSFGEFLEAFIDVGEVEISMPNGVSTDIYYGETIEVHCQAQSFPPPNIIWNMVAEFPIDFGTNTIANWTTGITTSVVTFTPDKSNNFFQLQCLAYNDFSINKTKSQQLSFNVYREPSISGTRSCSSSDFDNGLPCTLSCDFQNSNQANLVNFQWRYYIQSSTDFVPITKGASFNLITPFRYRMELSLSNYSAWNYNCWSEFFGNSSGVLYHIYPNNIFKISSETEYIALGSECTESEQCATLDASCSDQLCKCVEPNYIAINGSNNMTLACLSPAFPGDSCVNSRQCSEGANNYYCGISDTCDCGGIVMTIAKIDREECITKVQYGETCEYDEECVLADPQTFCNSDKCSCITDFYYDPYTHGCFYDSGSMSTVAIVVISISTCIVVAILFTILAGYIHRRRATKWTGNVTRNRSEIISEISGVPYEHLDDSRAVTRNQTAEVVPMQKMSSRNDEKIALESSSSSHIESEINSAGSVHSGSSSVKFY